ncbi:glycosyltransferase family 2 protein [Pseudoxanthomonas dokdonensis]|uniref:Beta 1,4 glucosyltransferase n=1 Tax=Pseudoxanthomonas dokdonensis TaxID=344882 RepID=A0A0R0CHG2_9GAMM|nr:glycosyltransferase family 2 protein [Pseudoxanthomonas dokdonensis]KRG69340.1 beta 1,4 glucosyltransferase [Pseudoxanthomonas dokdonensis]
MDRLPITLIVITYNEAGNIGRCLDSVPFAAEKLVIDSNSTDATVAIAQAHGARVVQQPWLGFGPQRNFASTQSGHDWIIVLDADEFLSDELIAECAQKLPALLASAQSGAWLRRRTWFMGGPMRWYKPMVGERMARIYHRGRARWKDVPVHESLDFDRGSEEFRQPFNHLHNPTILHKELKVLRYAELKARGWQAKRKSQSMWQTPLVFVASFVKEYLLRLALLDGWRGFIIAQLSASYAVYKRMRYYEMQVNPASVELARQEMIKHGLERE